MLKTLGLSVFAIIALGSVYVRFAPVEAAVWHVKPETITRTGKPNDYLVSEDGDEGVLVLEGSVADVAAKLDAIVLRDSRTKVLAGGAEAGFVTYVQRSRLIGYPDLISVTLRAAEGQTAVRIYARSKFGHSDLGVNKARMQRWIAALRS